MQPGKTFEDFFRAVAPYIGPMFAPPWWELARTGIPKRTDFTDSLWRASVTPHPIYLSGYPGIPRIEYARALCSAWGLSQARLRTVGIGAPDCIELVDRYSSLEQGECYHFEVEEIFEFDETLRGQLVRATERHAQRRTGTKLLLTGSDSGSPLDQSSNLREFLTSQFCRELRIPGLHLRQETILPWFLKYLIEHESDSPQAVSYFGSLTPMFWFGIRSNQPIRMRHVLLQSERDLAGFAQLSVDDPSRQTGFQELEPHLGKDMTESAGGEKRAEVKFGRSTLYPDLNPDWFMDIEGGAPVAAGKITLRIGETSSRYLISRSRMCSDYSFLLPKNDRHWAEPEDVDSQEGAGGIYPASTISIMVGESCRTLTINCESYDFSPRQGLVLQVLLRHFLKTGIPRMAQTNVKIRCDFDPRIRLVDVFKGCRAWGRVVSSARGNDYVWLGPKDSPWLGSLIRVENPEYVLEDSADFTAS